MALARACCTHRSALNAAHAVRRLSLSAKLGKEHFKLLIIGGGTAGAATSNKFGPYLGAAKVAVIEPSEMHYYQAGWTMVGGGMYDFEVTQRPEASVLNNKCIWIKDKVGQFSPEKNTVVTESGREIEYDFLVIAAGLQLRYDMIKGLPEAFETPGVCSNYHRDYVKKTFPALQRISEGNAIFTFPNTPVKCAGAPQKICYLSDAYLRK
uniref:FAD/NAD(P)-binding domain-containing protein n=1 Tax=Plectus sambesii TaxID=2011161 RepID=A0A914WL91_9BILA